MTIWIIEDDAAHARDAWQEIKSLAAEMDALARRHQHHGGPIPQARLFWDQSMSWKPTLKSLDGNVVPSEASNQLPDIVVLDLFREDQLAAPDLLRKLREWEWKEKRELSEFSHVILWSAYPGRVDALNFIRAETHRDRRVVAMDTKDATVLRANVAHCWQSREEERYP